ncbi:MAG TPA: S53 family peptidase [Thermoanaerobaculia bacterium]|nr:S53 family peptidase [Thermoanaerobaculia bacterium]
MILPGSVHPLARPELEIGRTDPGILLERIILSLRPRSGAQQELEGLLAEQQDPASRDYHRWLTPEQFGARFGPRDEDVAIVTEWLEAQGFKIDEVAQGRGWINFTGTVQQVEDAFVTEMHDYRVEGRTHHANAVEPSIPRGLSDLVDGIVSLNSFRARALYEKRYVGREATNTHGLHFLGPADFGIIYNVNPLYASGQDGTGQSIAIVGRTDIRLADVRSFRSMFGLPPNDPQFIHNGPAPGIVPGEEDEGNLDVEWAGAVARHATIKFVISANTALTDGVDLSAQYIVNNNLAPVMSTSFGLCEPFMGTTKLNFYNSLWSQAASQGITSFVSSGDSGASGCDSSNNASGIGRAVSGLCSTPFNVCVGGTQFDDTSSPSTYWLPKSDPTTLASALSYIPEIAWNESGNVTGGTGLLSSGGGASAVYTKPSWQSAPGVPSDGARDVPDVSLAAAGHDGYLVYLGDGPAGAGLYAFLGTSASAPSFAGLMALVVQKTGQRWGNANTVLYPMAASQYGGSGPAVFHDVVSGNNSVPGVTGFAAGAGYDLVTGLGSVNATALVDNWGSPSSRACVPGASTLCIDNHPGDGRFSVTLVFDTGSQAGNGTAISLQTLGIAHGGLFWFFGADNLEMLIKVLNGCSVNQKFWVFYAASTNVGMTIRVTDTKTGQSKLYANPRNTAAAPLQDTAAFNCAAGDSAAEPTSPAPPGTLVESRPAAGQERLMDFVFAPAKPGFSDAVGGGGAGRNLAGTSPAAEAACVPSASTLCIDRSPGDGRFAVSVGFNTGSQSGSGTAIPLQSLGVGHGGLFWFFGVDNPEMLVKVLDACSFSQHFWFFFSAATNVGFTVTLTDTVTGLKKTYMNPQNTVAAPVQDTSALPCS